jgi:chromosome segregation ATPase
MSPLRVLATKIFREFTTKIHMTNKVIHWLDQQISRVEGYRKDKEDKLASARASIVELEGEVSELNEERAGYEAAKEKLSGDISEG